MASVIICNKVDTITVEEAVNKLNYGACIMSQQFLFFKEDRQGRTEVSIMDIYLIKLDLLKGTSTIYDPKDMIEFIRVNLIGKSQRVIFGAGIKEVLDEWYKKD